MRVLVFGGRKYGQVAIERVKLLVTLDALHKRHNFTVLIHGAALGADWLAAEWAYRQGIEISPFPAQWSRYGDAAGAIRNRQMLTEGLPDLAIGFDGGKGTANMIDQVNKAGVPLTLIAAENEVQSNEARWW